MREDHILNTIFADSNHRIFCIYGEHVQESEVLQKEFDQIKKSPSASGISHQKIILLSSRAHYIERHKHEGLFFQQRYQSSYNDRGETVRQRLESRGKNVKTSEWDQWKRWFELDEIWEKPLLQLSSGEWQRFSLCAGLISRPEILIVPDLLNGLDREWQHKIFDITVEKVKHEGIIIFSSDIRAEHPAVLNIPTDPNGTKPTNSLPEVPPSLIKAYQVYQSKFLPSSTGDIQIQMDGVNIRYGKNQILKDIQWRVHGGEKWNIQGPNGAGKSTLISLVNADNPQGYSHPIYLFGKKYGKQSIWERKAHIAYFGSDFFQYFHSSKTLEEVLHQQLKTPYLETIQPPGFLIDGFFDYFGLDQYRNSAYSAVSTALRRQLLLLLTYLKSSDVLVLDEPYQDLSHRQIMLNNHFLESVQPHSQQTVIFVTHREDHKPGFLDQILKIDRGKISH